MLNIGEYTVESERNEGERGERVKAYKIDYISSIDNNWYDYICLFIERLWIINKKL